MVSMTSPCYVELHARSAFSFLRGASLPEALVDQAQHIGLPGLALLDRNGVYGAARFHTMSKERSFKSHVGAEIAVIDSDASRKTPGRQQGSSWMLTLLCESQEGYQNLCQLITALKLSSAYKCEGATTLDVVQRHVKGLICLTGGEEGPLAAAIKNGGEAGGARLIRQLIHLFGKTQVYVEVQRHGIREQEWYNQCALRIASSLGLPVVATNGVCYATAAEREILDVFECIRNGGRTSLESAGRLLERNSARCLRSPEHMQQLFADIPESIVATTEISKRLSFDLTDPGYQFPQYAVPVGETMDSFLHKRVLEGIVRRYGTHKAELRAKAEKQVKRELATIRRLGFAGYFLIVWDIVCFCKKHNILIQGRGSAANSAVCYALEITAVDPVRLELLFERFLSENRGEWPDIDLDLPSGNAREMAIQYIYKKYGELGAAMCANVITFRGRSAARETGKALGFSDEQIHQFSSLIGHWEWKGPEDTLQQQFSRAGFDISHPRIAKYLDLTLKMQDLPRHLGQHSGGMVICEHQLSKMVPLERSSMPGRVVVQWDKEDCAAMGMIKVDLLGLGMMAVIKDCIEIVSRDYGRKIDIADLPEDKTVFETLQKADTVGMFQVESRAQMASLPRNKPQCFYDIVVQVAIIRPGPIVGKMMNPYMRRRQGLEAVTYPHELLEPILKRTLGVPLFQEQLLRMAMVAANFSGTEAEELRRAVGMRRSLQRMKDLEVKLRAGMSINKISTEVQDGLIQSISSFALYGFPESHAASFALIAYASAFMKVNYLAAFTCAMLNNQPMGFYMPAVIVSDAQRHGLKIRPIDVAHSAWDCTLEHEAADELVLRLGLRYVKGLSQQTGTSLVRVREQKGAFRSTEEIKERVPEMTRRELVQLAKVGAFNGVGTIAHRRDALWQVEKAGRPAGPLLDKVSESLDEDPSPLQPMSAMERLTADYGTAGLTVGLHPMCYQRSSLKSRRVLSMTDLKHERDGSWVRAAGCVIARQRPGTASGFVFLSLEDETGIGNIIVDPNLFEEQRRLVTHGKFLFVEGVLQNQNSVIHIKAKKLEKLGAVN